MTASQLTGDPADLRRGACPALSAPMMTGDGLLTRIALTEAISPAQLAELSRLARRHGNGMIDISARGNLQVRGLTGTTAPLLDADVRALDLPLRDGLAVEIPPLAGLDPHEIADPRPLAAAIADRARNLTGLAPKMSVVVDGGGQLRLSNLLADIRIVAMHTTDGIRWKILLGSTEKSGRLFNVLRETQTADTVFDILEQLAALGNKARGRDLASGPPGNYKRATGELELGLLPISPLAGEMPGRAEGGSSAHTSATESTATNGAASPFSPFELHNGHHAVGIGPAYGQVSAEYLIPLCCEATHLGITSVKPALDHSLLFFGSPDACRALAAFAGSHGFITSSTDPRSHIAACPGSPACNSATIATHDIATRATAECGDFLDGSFKLHITGCAKGCAHPQATGMTLCGTAAGISLIAGGKAGDEPFASTAFADTNATLRRLADLVGSERRASENSAACLARLGSERLAAAVLSGRS